MKLYCYAIPPIDFWDGALTDAVLMRQLSRTCDGDWERLAKFCSDVSALRGAAEAAFKQIGWEGDVREGPFFFFLPGEDTTSMGYMLKHDNNGGSFVASPHPLPHLKVIKFEEIVVG